MPPIQNTFSIIPAAPSAINGNGDITNARPSRPPMTTKQVKKAYQKANKGPKISKAEQRRIELFEQDRIRKEFEKEKNQARARAARDKKKEKEERERAEKKKKGLPLVDVRPSQDTIARFVRGKSKSQRDDGASPFAIAKGNGDEGRNGSLSPPYDGSDRPSQKQQLDDIDKENIQPPERTEGGSAPFNAIAADKGHGLDHKSPIIDHTEPPNKKRRVNVPGEEDEAPLPIVNEATLSSPKPDPKVAVAGDQPEEIPNPGAKQTRPNIDDSFSTIDFSEDDLDNLICEAESVYGSPIVPNKGKFEQRRDQNPLTEHPSPKPPENYVLSSQKTEKPSFCMERVARPIESLSYTHQAVLMSESIPDVTKTPRRNPISVPEKQVSTPQSTVFPPTMAGNCGRSNTPRLEKLQEDASSTRGSQPTAPSTRSFRHPRTPMAPPPGPPKFKSANPVSAGQPRTPQFLKPPLPSVRTTTGKPFQSHMTKPKQVRESDLPPSTQLFILSHLDDFLPSPSQEVREIFEEPKRKDTGMRNNARLSGTYSSHITSKPNLHRNPNPTMPNNRSVSATLGITPRGPRHIQKTAERVKLRGAAVQPCVQPISQNISSAFEMPFFSTQDLLLSSQDVKDIEEEPLSARKAQASNSMPSKEIIKPIDSAPVRPSPKSLFSSICPEMGYKYAIERSKTAAWEGISARQKVHEDLDQLQALENRRLEELLVLDTDDEEGEEKEKNGTVVARSRPDAAIAVRGSSAGGTQSRGTPAPLIQPSRGAQPTSLDRSRQSSVPIPSSASIPEEPTGIQSNQNNSRKPSDAQGQGQGPRLGSTTCKSQQNAKPKSSPYEAMLELLAKGPTQSKSNAQQQKRIEKGVCGRHIPDRDRGGNTEYQNQEITEYQQHLEMTEEQAQATTITIPASQETDYDCGEDLWDDDDWLRDIL
ncbi:hypothetical protein HD806DRAFT_506427 [Xylariaceae sp. AK1471]|nr:hypothetical protein HD806DRAFT_506427 [Xylariaceae sp. AK1471]